MYGTGVEQAGEVEVPLKQAVESHENESQNETVVLEVAMVDEDGIRLDQQQQQKEILQFPLEERGNHVDSREEDQNINQQTRQTHVDLQSLGLVTELESH